MPKPVNKRAPHSDTTTSRTNAPDGTARTRTPQTGADPAHIVQRARHSVRALGPGDILRLQRSIGNRATANLLRGTAGRQPKSTPVPATPPMPAADHAPPLPGVAAPGTRGEAPVQRKVGFEFETNVTVKAGDAPIIAKRVHLYDGTDWNITPDSGKIEFVTEPFDEEAVGQEEEGRLGATMKEIFIFLSTLLEQSSSKPPQVLLENVPPGKALRFKNQQVYVEPENLPGSIVGRPQVTGGVNLENIPRLMETAMQYQLPVESQIYDAQQEQYRQRMPEEQTPIGGDEYKQNVKNIEDAFKAAGTYIKSLEIDEQVSLKEVEKLQGFLTLIYHYLYSGLNMAKAVNQAKYPFSFMSRMSFTAMYLSLDESVQKLFSSDRILKIFGEQEKPHLYERPLRGNVDDYRAKVAKYAQDACYSDELGTVLGKMKYPKIEQWMLDNTKTPDDMSDLPLDTDGWTSLIDYLVKEQVLAENAKDEAGPTRQQWLESIPPPQQPTLVNDFEEGIFQRLNALRNLSEPLDQQTSLESKDNNEDDINKVDDELDKQILETPQIMNVPDDDILQEGNILDSDLPNLDFPLEMPGLPHADLLSASSGSAIVEGYSFSSSAMGEHNKLDPDHEGNLAKLVQLELRSLPVSVPFAEWYQLAMSLFNMFRKVQGGK